MTCRKSVLFLPGRGKYICHMLTVENIPAPLSFIEDMEPFRIASDDPFLFSLIAGGMTHELRETYSPGPAGDYVEIDVRELLRSAFNDEPPWKGSPETSLKGLPLSVMYMIDDSPEHFGRFSVFPGSSGGKISGEFLSSHWLTHQPQTKEISPVQPEWLTFYYMGSTGGSFVARFYSSVSGEHEDVVLTDSLKTGECYRVDVSPQRVWGMSDGPRYGLYDVFACDADGTRLTYVQRYVITHESPDDRYFVCLNSLGGWDSFRLAGSREYAPETDYAVVADAEGLKQGGVTSERTFVQKTGPLKKNELRWLTELLESRLIYIRSDSTFRRIVITESSVSMLSSETVRSVEFSYIYSDESGLPAPERDMSDPPFLPVPDPGDILLMRVTDMDGSPVDAVELPFGGDAQRIIVTSKKAWILQ